MEVSNNSRERADGFGPAHVHQRDHVVTGCRHHPKAICHERGGQRWGTQSGNGSDGAGVARVGLDGRPAGHSRVPHLQRAIKVCAEHRCAVC